MEIISLSKQQADVYNSIACDYMDAAQAQVSNFDKVPKPYLDAINCQRRMLNFLDELKALNEVGVVSEEKSRNLQERV